MRSLRSLLAVALVAGCGSDPGSGTITDELTMFFRMEETGDVPRRDAVNDVRVFPWQRLAPGTYHQDGIGTTAVPAIVGNGQHIDGAIGYHFAAAGTPVMDHHSGGFTWVGWASIDAADEAAPYLDNQTLLAKWTGVPDTDIPHDRREYRVWFEPGLEQWRLEVSSDGLEGDGHSVIVTHPTAIERDRMYFVEAWHDADAQSVNLRVSDRDGLGTVESVAWDLGVHTNAGDLDIGAQNACADDHLQGTIDALGYWTRVLTDDERASLWNSGNGTEF